MTADLVYLVAGGSLLLAVLLPALLKRWAVSAPMVLVAVGMVIGITPLPDGMPLDPQHNRAVIEHATELTVIVALMGVGLALDRPLLLRRRDHWRAWRATWLLLVVGMPLTIGAVALLGWWAGLAPAAAILLGAALSPTDPVLASDVQVAGPQTGDHEVDERDELRFTLTSEAGLNDGLAFPFVYLAILTATASTSGWGWLAEWAAFHLVGKVVIGIVAGIVVGRVLAAVAFRARSPSLRVAERGEALLALAALVTAYGVAEVAQGYGFLAVFACGMTFRQAERSHDYHAAMHEVTERLERLLTMGVLLFLGIALTRGMLEALDWRGVAIGLALLLVIRPLSGVAALASLTHRTPDAARDGDPGTLAVGQLWATAFFGVRGVGSIYYLAYASGKAPVLASDWLWSTVTFTVVASVLLHGVLATPVMHRIDPDRAQETGGRGQDGGVSAIEDVRRWHAAGGHWQVVHATDDAVVVSLCTCDGGEEMGRVTLSPAELAQLEEPPG
ncbi:cation:proton antiporter [Nocardioides sp. TF02-7]|uniref:cation:proton antiporter n=1 Tax=Nocardioides sp. TF02-7 TaxID=2917724 RepID=UPI001F056B8D|nr:cation:proton antiporter [Nocardioides sp. TF02-7]UMG91556.1 cation:proton antiporter [Nocardioides sp. TF02-7]